MSMTQSNRVQDSSNLPQQEWWVIRWLELLDSYRFKKRLERARNYAREGHVLSIEFSGSQVLAKVQGTEPEPYQVSLSLDPFTDEDWNFIIESLSKKAIFSAQLLAGRMPDNIERVFIENGLSVFPFTLSDVHSRCSCPDKANPCKHIGAIYYQLAERFSEDPFIIFQLRGRTKSQILKGLRQFRKQERDPKDSSSENLAETVNQTEKIETKKDPGNQELDVKNFWQYKESLDPSLVVIVPPTDNKTVLDVLGRIPLAYEEAKIVKDYLQQVYQMVSQQAMMTALNRDE
ncbi:unknown [Crocosphaera subtropica ATCC 51142]|uniref:SWIM-type domain-containing protein n=1 Tax=Crocosphaera subtropica (strain ATCC 51142 / BH68) TaxID=43989 RepID=B1WW19_CROS5|nr:unknown [Crocosphaera subtropica ATCC 51142]